MNFNKNKKVTRFRRPFYLNIGIIVFLIIFLYIIINIILFITQDKISVTQVLNGTITEGAAYTGIIIRDEEVINAEASGYINYSIDSGSKAAKHNHIYLLSKDNLATNVSTDSLVFNYSEDDYQRMREALSQYTNSYSDSKYYNLHSFKQDIQNKVTESISKSAIDDIQATAAEGGNTQSYAVYTNDRSGLISYTYDGLESLTADQITDSLFNSSDYEQHQLRANDFVKAGAPVYKLTQGEDWSIVIKLNDAQVVSLANKSSVTIKFAKDDVTAQASVNIYSNGESTYAKLDLSKYLIRHLEERYIDIELIISTATGLKIPSSAVLEKDFYKIPVEYLVTDEATTEKGFNISYYDKSGELRSEFVKTTIYHNDKEFCYVDKSEFELGDYISKLDDSNEETYRIGATGQLKGVYNINQGYAIFRLVQIVYQNEEYCIAKDGVPYGITLYDYIVLNSSSVSEDQIIY